MKEKENNISPFNFDAEIRELIRCDKRLYTPNNITADNLKDLLKELRNYEVKYQPETNVLLEISTSGGDVGATMELALALYHSPLTIITLVTNKCYSAGIPLAASGNKDYRFAYPEADFMIHPPTYSMDSKVTISELKQTLQIKERAQERFLNLISRFTDIPLQRLYDEFNDDIYFDAKAAVALGVIDAIVVPR
jgi:ATP-dependent Clp protease protease subunit